jgi:hypothetical protein
MPVSKASRRHFEQLAEAERASFVGECMEAARRSPGENLAIALRAIDELWQRSPESDPPPLLRHKDKA